MKRSFLIPALLLLGAVGASAATYRVGLVPEQERAQLIAKWTPILSALSDKAGVKLTLDTSADDYASFYAKYAAGAYDVAFINPLAYVGKTNMGAYRPFVRQDAKIQGIVVVRKENPAQSLKDLAKKTIAFPSRDSYGATVMVLADLAAAGVDERAMAIDYLGSHNKVYGAVASGNADAGGGVMRTFLQLKPEESAKLRILHTTAPSVTHPFVASAKIPEEDFSRIRRAFLTLGDTPEGRALLKSAGMSSLIPATDADYDSLRAHSAAK